MQSSESPLKLSMERIDLLASVKGLPLVSPKSNVLAYPNHTTRNRAYSATKLHKHVLNTGYSTPQKPTHAFGSTTKQSTSKPRINAVGSQITTPYHSDAYATSTTSRLRSAESKQQTHLSVGKKNQGNSQALIMETSPGRRVTGLAGQQQQQQQSVLHHSSITGIHVKHTENQSDKTQISRLGLKLQPICPIAGHERSKIIYVCTDTECKNQEKFGCAHCFLEDHAEHANRIIKMDEFVRSVETKHEQYISSVGNLSNLSNILAHPAFLTDISNSLEYLKEAVCKRIDEFKVKIEGHVRLLIQEDSQIAANEVNKQEEVLNTLKNTMTKNLFEMSNSEFSQALSIHNDQLLSDLLKRTKAIQDIYNDYDINQTSIFQPAINSLHKELLQVIQPYYDYEGFRESEKLIINSGTNNNNNHNTFKKKQNNNLNSKLQSNSKTNSSTNKSTSEDKRLSSQRQPTSDNLFGNRTNANTTKSNSKQGLALIGQDDCLLEDDTNGLGDAASNGSSEQRIAEIQLQKKISESKLQKNLKLIEELQNIHRDINYISVKQHFPYIIYQESCSHTVRCNTVPIFECCKQAYRCVICHDAAAAANHRYVITNPSKRYCMYCYKIFQVKFNTDVPINCKECLAKEKQLKASQKGIKNKNNSGQSEMENNNNNNSSNKDNSNPI